MGDFAGGTRRTRDGRRYLCGICDRAINARDLQWDHIVPRAAGGPHRSANLQPAHRRCNGEKRDKPLTLARSEYRERMLGPRNLVSRIVRAIGGDGRAAAATGSTEGAVGVWRHMGYVPNARFCLGLARAWAMKHGDGPESELSMARRLAGLE